MKNICLECRKDLKDKPFVSSIAASVMNGEEHIEINAGLLCIDCVINTFNQYK